MVKEIKQKEENWNFQSKYGLKIEDMFNAGLHLGHIKSKWNPKMAPYVFTVRNGVRIIDLEKTIVRFEEILDFLKKSVSEGKKILFVGTRFQDKDIIKELAEKTGMPYVNNRWVGGLFTNFGIIVKRLKYFRDLENAKQKGDLGKYTKKERIMFDKELARLEKFMGGIKALEKCPDIIFIFDTIKDVYALREAKKSGSVVTAVVNTEANPARCDYFIPAGNNSFAALKYIAGKIEEVLKK
ncbi:MAG: 30S ribosomal protein S2 [Parcubacteria group bacterium GW2011_GWA2_38_13b]|nr:MAG: 30S ribosomal protein S2 [Parcubacteria group bacterium GW2011_GWA2_38_13b]